MTYGHSRGVTFQDLKNHSLYVDFYEIWYEILRQIFFARNHATRVLFSLFELRFWNLFCGFTTHMARQRQSKLPARADWPDSKEGGVEIAKGDTSGKNAKLRQN